MTSKVKPAKSKDKLKTPFKDEVKTPSKDKVKTPKDKLKTPSNDKMKTPSRDKLKTRQSKELKRGSASKSKKKSNVFKVVENEKVDKLETDEDFHKMMTLENSKKAKKKEKPEPINLLIQDEDEDLDFSREDAGSDEASDEEDELGDYQKFNEEISRLDGKKHKIAGERTEGAGEVSEYNLSAAKGNKVGLEELLSALGDKEADVRSLSRRLGTTEKEELTVPLERPAAERVTRAAGYAGAKKEVSVWDAVVHSRRAADQVTFPLLKPDLKLQGASQIKTRFAASTPLEQQVVETLLYFTYLKTLVIK